MSETYGNCRWHSLLDNFFLDYENRDPVHQWTRMPSCDEFVGASRSKHTVVPYKGAIYVFGGDNGKSMLNDLLRFDVKEKSWVRAVTTSSQRPPAPRYHHSAVVYNTSMFIFGGYTGDIHSNSNLTNNNDLYEYNFKTGQWIKWIFKGIAPVPRSAHGAAVYDGRLWILAGYDGNARLNDMWTISLQSYTVHIDPQNGEIREGIWERITQLGECPPTCCNFPVAVAGDSMYVFSGHSGAKITNSLFKFHFHTRVWTRINPYKVVCVVPPSPIRRYGHTMVAYDNSLYVFGGTADSTLSNDLHRFDLETSTWSIVDVVNNSETPSGRLFHAAAVENGCMFIFGGTVDKKIRSGEMHRFKFSNYPRCTLHNDFRRIFESKLFADVEFVVGKDNVRFACHIPVIAARSPWLTEKIREAMIDRFESRQVRLNRNEMIDEDTGRLLHVYLHDMVPDAFEMVLEYIYTDCIDHTKKHVQEEDGFDRQEEYNGDNPVGYHVLLIMDVYIIAKQMEITRLEQLCLHYIEVTINQQNVLVAFRAASSLGLPLIKNLCLKFIVKDGNYLHFIMSNEFETLDGQLMVEIVRAKHIPNARLFEKPSLELGHSLEEDMAALIKQSTFSDITLVLHGNCIPAHKAILAARCGYFEAMFRSFMPKDNLVHIQIGEIVPSQQSLDSLLKYIYFGSIVMPPQDSLYLYSASHFFSFTNNRLQAFCKENLEMNVSCSNVLEILEAAHEMDATDMKNYALHLIVLNFTKVAQLPKLNSLSHGLLVDILQALARDMSESKAKEKLRLCQEIIGLNNLSISSNQS